MIIFGLYSEIILLRCIGVIRNILVFEVIWWFLRVIFMVGNMYVYYFIWVYDILKIGIS